MGTLSDLGGGSSRKSSGSSSSKGTLASLGGGSAPSDGGGGGLVGALKGGLGKVIGSQPVRTVLGAIDTPRAAVMSGIKETTDALQGEGFSLDDLVQQTKSHYGFGQYLEDEGGDRLPLNLKRALGLIGDIGLDPLTYVTLGSSAVAKSSLKGSLKAGASLADDGARLSARQVARRAVDLGEDEIARKILGGRGTHALSDAEKALVGVDSRVRFGVGKHSVAIPNSEVIPRLRAAITNPILDRLPRGERVTEVLKNLDPTAKAMVDLRREDPVAAMKLVTEERASRAVGEKITKGAQHELTALHKQYGGLDGTVVARLIEDEPARLAGVAADVPEAHAAAAFGDWFEKVRAAAEQLGGRDIPKIENYLPHQLTAEFREAMADEGVKVGSNGAGKAAFERMREHRVGSKWFGKELRTGSLDEMETIAREALGDGYVQVFKGDPWALAHSYANTVGRTTADHNLRRRLVGSGLAEKFDEAALVAAEGQAKTLGKKSAKQTKKADRLDAAAAAKLAEVEDLRTAVPAPVEAVPPVQSPVATGLPEGRPRAEILAEAKELQGLQAKLQKIATSGTPEERSVLGNSMMTLPNGEPIRVSDAPAWVKQRAAELKEELSSQMSTAAPAPPVAVEAAQAGVEAAVDTPQLALVEKLESEARELTAQAMERRGRAADFDKVIQNLKVPEKQAAWSRLLDAGFKDVIAADPTLHTRPEIVAILDELKEKATPPQVGKFLKTYDSGLSRWKAYSLLSPGFHVRNYLGGQWNNWMAGVPMTSRAQREFPKAMRAYQKGGLDEVRRVMGRGGDEWVNVFEQADLMSVWGGHNLRDLADIGNEKQRGALRAIASGAGVDLKPGWDKLDPTSMNFKPLTMNVSAGEYVEKMLRGPLFADRIFKGFSPEAALDDVVKYHFDYNELSQFERKFAKRALPFYTWTRKNFPLQLENLMANPGKFNRMMTVKRNVELGTEEPDGVPSYVDRLFGVLLPWKKDGQPLFATPDLPINRFQDSPFKQITSGLSPAAKLPLELWGNKSFYTDVPLKVRGEEASAVPGAFAPLAPLLHQLDGAFGLPKVGKTKDGYVMDRREAYKIEQALPILGRLRRLVPTEDKFRDRAFTSRLSNLAGVNGFTLTDEAIKSEYARRTGGR
jgi:hypothetical protein